ncbi:hypothetical protein AX16_009369 [Volvariella volvacea WC 439]|nr:hypothetical protein AX16_009369 [Volvariella volvacea WC 439]
MPYPIHIQQQSQLQQVQMQHQHPYIHDAHQPQPHAPYGDSLQDVHHAFDSSCSPPTTNTSPAFPVHMVDHYRHSSHIPLTEQTTDLNDQYNDFSRGSSLSYLHHQDSCYISVADRGFSSTRHSPATWDGASLDVTSGMSVADNATLGYNMYRPEDLTGYASWWTLSGSTPTANGYNDTTHGQAIHESGVEMAASSITVGSVGIGLGVGGSLAVNHGEMGMAAGGLDFVSTATIASTATSGHGQLSLKPSIETDAYPPDTPVLCSPTARLPTPAAMAILLNRDRTHTPTLSQPYPPPPIRNPVSGGTPIGPGVAGITGTMSISSTQSRNIIAVTNRMNRSTDGVNGVVIPGPYSRAGEHGSQSREKKHACTMCHKRSVLV